jgi:hypothetical protein
LILISDIETDLKNTIKEFIQFHMGKVSRIFTVNLVL